MKAPLPEDDFIGFQLAPMIDCILLLIIFFMTTSRVQNVPQVKMDVPKAQAGRMPFNPMMRSSVSVTPDGKLFIGMAPATLDEIPAFVSTVRSENPKARFFLRADRTAPFREVRRVMGALAAAGVSDITFAVLESQ